jgi:hypothetical protein
MSGFDTTVTTKPEVKAKPDGDMLRAVLTNSPSRESSDSGRNGSELKGNGAAIGQGGVANPNGSVLTFDENGGYVIEPGEELIQSYIDDIRQPDTYLQELEGDIAATELEVYVAVFSADRRYNAETDEVPIAMTTNPNFGMGEELNGQVLHVNGNHYVVLEEAGDEPAEYVDEDGNFYREGTRTREDGNCQLDALHIVATGEPIPEEKIQALRNTIADAVDPDAVKQALTAMITTELDSGERPQGLGETTQALINSDPILGGVLEQKRAELNEMDEQPDEESEPEAARLAAECSEKEYKEAFAELKGLRGDIIKFGADGEHLNKVSGLMLGRGKAPTPEQIATLNEVFAALATQKRELEQAAKRQSESAEAHDKGEKSAYKAGLLKTFCPATLRGFIGDSQMLNDRSIAKLMGKAVFPWTNIKGCVGECLMQRTLETQAAKMSKESGGEGKIINVKVMAGNSSVREIDGLHVSIERGFYVIKGIFEAKTTKTGGKTNLAGDQRTVISKKVEALRDAVKKHHQVFIKLAGEELGDDITNKLRVDSISPKALADGAKTIGPKRDDGAQYDITFADDVDVDDLTDALACIWVEQGHEFAAIEFGTAKQSKLQTALNKQSTKGGQQASGAKDQGRAKGEKKDGAEKKASGGEKKPGGGGKKGSAKRL